MNDDTELANITPPRERDVSKNDRDTLFSYFCLQLTKYRNTTQRSADLECSLAANSDRDNFMTEINHWAQVLLETAWTVCYETNTPGKCPSLDSYPGTPTDDLPTLPAPQIITKFLNPILFLHITTTKQYSARTRTFLSTLGPLDEQAILSTLKNPKHALDEAQKRTQEAKADHADRGKALRVAGAGLGAVAGGVLIGVTGGLAAPLVGAGVTTLLGWLGVGGTALGLLASGLASSSVVCGALFGAYGARSTMNMVERHTREVRDLAIVPVNQESPDETLGVRLCVSGWLASPEDVTAPWTIFGGDATFALQWEIEALQNLSNALMALIKSHAMKYVKVEIIKRTALASLMASLSPIALLKIGQMIDNPWMNTKALAIKTGAVLGDLLAKRVFGTRPVTLTGYSLGSLVIYEALIYLASLPSSETVHLIQDVYLFGTPAPANPKAWSSIRRVVSGRVVNGYSTDDYVLAVLSRASDVKWNVSGLQAVEVEGVENVLCENVSGHTMWRGMIGTCLKNCDAPGLD